ncbi:GntR family transcriptional regulator [Nocardia sp. NBC_00508]|uniref:GntR family transcriptional regulator n=1 Tax=Nocardia sp. NBC_00508 TaxID=2975992 RepID=UPI002E80895E|nr:GntR family transcriptional regulator [Nocardia sp. NBC_00508]WUD67076.1 GntR family transcriptional regulator [Nocardia sp. NBC_00508]
MRRVERDVAYRTLADRLRAAIGEGQFGEGNPLPTEEQLATTHAVSRSTVRRAMQDLVAEGLIYRVAGRGTFPVAESGRYLRHVGSIEDLIALSVDTICEIISPLQLRVDIEAAGRMGLSSDSVSTLTLRRLFDDTPIAITTVTLPPSIGRLLHDVREFATAGSRGSVTVIGSIDSRMPGTIRDAEQTITAVAASDAVAEGLECHVGAPVLRIDRLYSDTQGRAVELAVSYFNPDYYTYRVNLRRKAN